ncbi:MAG TPA: alpha-L-arabinofuranosidase C-terminal domain-containing protein, partial [Verrucomicrobiae bacterium]|nr:alpha-L-arabinofuranosidase C-terminal domain-containing protein [Verrucomicrobiae bacterium]
VVRMASYAPLFANTEAWQWTPDLIWVDSLHLYKTPNYYVQQLFSCNRGDVVLPTQLAGIETNSAGIQTLYASATRDEAAGEIILKVVNPADAAQKVTINLVGAKQVSPRAEQIVLAGNPHDQNSMRNPAKIAPATSTIDSVAATFPYSVAPHSMTLLRIHAR